MLFLAKVVRVALLWLPLSTLLGCSAHHQQRLATQAVGFNLTVEEAQNEMLLLNVIRAKDRFPMYLTAVSSLSGNVSTSLTAGLGGSYSEGTEDTTTLHNATGGTNPVPLNTLTDLVKKTITRGLSPSLSGTLARNPNFTLAVLDGEKFMRGFLAPVQPKTLAHFWDQGWPRELLLYLLVQRVEADGGVHQNYPPKADEFREFAKWVKGFIAKNPRIIRVVSSDPFGPELTRGEITSLSELVTTAKEGLTLVPVDQEDRWQLHRGRVNFLIAVDGCAPDTKRPDVDVLQGTMSTCGGDEAVITLRSPEGVLYYLGELMRVATQSQPRIPQICIQGEYQPLFVALPMGEMRECEEPAVQARSPWGDYAIPPVAEGRPEDSCQAAGELRSQSDSAARTAEEWCDAGRSMQALRLLSQLISLQKSADELPSPALVRVIGE